MTAGSYEIKLKAFLDPSDQWEKSDFGVDGQPPAWCNECKLHNQHFDGESKMNFSLKQAADFLVVHSRYLVYEDLVLKKGETGNAIKYNLREDKDQEYIVLSFDGELQPGDYTLESKYIGFLQPNNFGLYISNYEENGKTHWIASTQMEGPYARRTFPCFDEPPYKATYKTTLMHQETYPWTEEGQNGYYSLSNQEVKSDFPTTSDGWVTTEFEETERMSTYLTAFAIVDFSSADVVSPESKTPSEILARKQLIGGERHMDDGLVTVENPVWFPKECTARTTDRLGEALNLNYNKLGRTKKADQIGLPDFDAGAMENWGLVTYREQSLLFDMDRDRIRN